MRKLPIVLAVASTLILSTCGSDEERLEFKEMEITGRHDFPAGGYSGSVPVRYQVLLEGSGFFKGNPRCENLPNHMAALASYEARPDAEGRFTLRPRITDFRARTDRNCPVTRVGRGNLTSVRVQAQLAANETSCTKWCESEGGAGSCVADCAENARVFFSNARTSAVELQGMLAGVSAARLSWSPALPFENLGDGLTEGDGPDLTPDAEAAQRTAQITFENFEDDRCGVEASCVRAFGLRKLLRFDGTIINRGNKDFVLDPNDPFLNFNVCHGHNHLDEILLYELVDPSGAVVSVAGEQIVGRKQSFCMMDTYPVNDVSAGGGGYDCDRQGISAGWADLYESSLECQFLDVTGVAAGSYLLRITVNPDLVYDELDYSNNTIEIPVQVTD